MRNFEQKERALRDLLENEERGWGREWIEGRLDGKELEKEDA